MGISMKDFQGLMGNNPNPRTEPKKVGPAPMEPTKEDKLNGDDLAMDPRNRVGSKTTQKPATEEFHGSAEEKLPKDKTGYPTTKEPVLVDKAGIGATIGIEEAADPDALAKLRAQRAAVSKSANSHLNNMRDIAKKSGDLSREAKKNAVSEAVHLQGYDAVIEEAKAAISGAVTEGVDSDLIAWFKLNYKAQLENYDDYLDLPIVRSMEFVLNKAVCECDNVDAMERKELIESEMLAAMNQINIEAGFCPNQRNLNELTPMDPSIRVQSYPMYPYAAGERTVSRLIDELTVAESDEEIGECFVRFARASYLAESHYDVVGDTLIALEGAGAREASRKVRTGLRNATRKVSKASKETKRNVKKALDPMSKFIMNSIEKAKDADAEERRNMIIKGGIVPKIIRWIKRSILLIAGGKIAVAAASPTIAVITAIAFLGWVCTDASLDNRQKQKIMRELEDEIEIVNEKIEDARGDSNKQKKYELMRIRNKLNRTQTQIKLNLGGKLTGHDMDDGVFEKGTKDKKK